MKYRVLSNVSCMLGIVFIVNPLLGVGQESWLSNGNICILLSIIFSFLGVDKKAPKMQRGFASGGCIVGSILTVAYLLFKIEAISLALLLFGIIHNTIMRVCYKVRKELGSEQRKS